MNASEALKISKEHRKEPDLSHLYKKIKSAALKGETFIKVGINPAHHK